MCVEDIEGVLRVTSGEFRVWGSGFGVWGIRVSDVWGIGVIGVGVGRFKVGGVLGLSDSGFGLSFKVYRA